MSDLIRNKADMLLVARFKMLECMFGNLAIEPMKMTTWHSGFKKKAAA